MVSSGFFWEKGVVINCLFIVKLGLVLSTFVLLSNLHLFLPLFLQRRLLTKGALRLVALVQSPVPTHKI